MKYAVCKLFKKKKNKYHEAQEKFDLIYLFQKPDTIKTNMANNISNKKTFKNIKKK